MARAAERIGYAMGLPRGVPPSIDAPSVYMSPAIETPQAVHPARWWRNGHVAVRSNPPTTYRVRPVEVLAYSEIELFGGYTAMTVPREVVKEAWRSQDQAYDDRLNGEGQLCRDHRPRSTQHPI